MCICLAMTPMLLCANKCTGPQGEPEETSSAGTEADDDVGGGTGGAAIVEGSITDPPDGLEFTDENGDPIEDYEGDVTVHLRTDSGDVVFSFQPSGNINFSNVRASRSGNKTVLHFNSDNDKLGISGSVGLHVPGLSNLSELRICPDARTLRM